MSQNETYPGTYGLRPEVEDLIKIHEKKMKIKDNWLGFALGTALLMTMLAAAVSLDLRRHNRMAIELGYMSYNPTNGTLQWVNPNK